jgi:ABC-type Fe3+/spermidine/putrescine transport system ATPase subunit
MITLQNITYAIGTFRLAVSLEIRDDDYFVLAGKTGCGKTTLIECICGLKPVTGGRILVDGIDVTGSDPRHRHIGYVPQDGALFDHLNVRDNILFSLTVARAPHAEMSRTLGELSEKLSIVQLLGRPINGLSGGERQRVALARALASRPRALLLDEPVSALDESTRDIVCRELLRIHRDFQIPVIHVCHSSEETRLVASRMAIMRAGSIVQIDAPEALFDHPCNAFIANFLRIENVLSGTGIRLDGQSFIRLNGVDFRADAPEGAVTFLVRPWQVGVCGAAPGDNIVEGRIREFAYAGPTARLQVDGALPLVAQVARRDAEALALAVGKTVKLSFPPGAVHVMNPITSPPAA